MSNLPTEPPSPAESEFRVQRVRACKVRTLGVLEVGSPVTQPKKPFDGRLSDVCSECWGS